MFTTRFDAADYLASEDRQVAYIAAAIDLGDPDFVCDALAIVARARQEESKRANQKRGGSRTRSRSRIPAKRDH
jgi:DNA-binding phage protein